MARPWLGERKRLPVRLPELLAEKAQAKAAQRGMSFNDFVTELIANAVAIDGRQEEVPLTKSA